MAKNHISKTVLLGVSILLLGPVVQAKSVEIQERERMLGEKVLNVGMCSSEGYLAGRAYIPKHVLRVTYLRSYEKYLVEQTSDGWFGESSEKLVEGSNRMDERREIVNHTFGNGKDCQYWEQSTRAMIEDAN